MMMIILMTIWVLVAIVAIDFVFMIIVTNMITNYKVKIQKKIMIQIALDKESRSTATKNLISTSKYTYS